MDRAKIPYHSDTGGFIKSLDQDGELDFISDHSADESFDLETSSIEDDYYLVEDFKFFKDVARSKKFYLKKKILDEPKLNELEDVFMEKSAEEETDSEEEKILQVVWSDEDPLQNKLVRFVEALEMKKSNSKFTLSMLDEERVSADIESIEGEEIKGRFLEVKDSLEVLATSSRNLHVSRYSDWDFTVDEDQEVNRIWRKSDSQWTSSLQIEIGKLPSQADQETVLQVLDDGAQGKISVRDVTECLGNLLESANMDKDGYPSKKVSFCAVPSKSCLSKESLSQTSTQSGRSSSHKKVSFYTENYGDNFEEIEDMSNKKLSVYELACDEDLETLNQSENGKIKKSVSFHDSVDFEKIEKVKENDSSITGSSQSECNTNNNLVESPEKLIFSEKVSDYCNQDELSNHSGLENSTISDTAASGYSFAESFGTFSTRTSLDGSIDVSECRDVSDFSLHSSKHEDRALPVHLLKFLNDQINTLGPNDPNDVDSSFGYYSNRSKGTEEKSDDSKDSINKILTDVRNEIKSVIKDLGLGNQEETNEEKIEFIRNLIEDSLNRKFEECESSSIVATTFEDDNIEEIGTNGIGKTIQILYDHCKDMVNIDHLSKRMGLAMAFQEPNLQHVTIGLNEFIPQKDLCPLTDLYSLQENENHPVQVDSVLSSPTDQEHLETILYDEPYMSADSDSDLQVNQVATSDLPLSFALNRYINTDYPATSDDNILCGEERKSEVQGQEF